MAFLMIEIDESERDFTRFFWDENPGIDLENKRLDIFRMTRVLFGSLYVDDFLCGNVSVQAALTTCIESKQILEDARLDWDDKLPKQVEVSWNKWCNEIHYLSEIKIPRYYFQNFLPSNATTIQLHCFSDASKKAYGTVAYLRIELNDGNIISSFVASKGRVAPLKTLSIPRLELMDALLSASTKATHLEVVSDLTTEAFLACLRRFIARRSKPSVIWSDNATNFKGARNILNEWNEISKSNRIQLFSAEEGIEWNFIPPASPHFGGLWDANIKSMKRILLRVAKSAIMNFEELTTLMAQIEAVLNSRPLSPLSSDPNDLNPLTPGHFLTNCAISSFPEPYIA
ncbi:integrase catalytic domain-containing protein [Trichonephila clavipes]|nr:integrase catalytic domain-containing protein [Trichonephila clavipes]